jgi:DNA repair protein RAD50
VEVAKLKEEKGKYEKEISAISQKMERMRSAMENASRNGAGEAESAALRLEVEQLGQKVDVLKEFEFKYGQLLKMLSDQLGIGEQDEKARSRIR